MLYILINNNNNKSDSHNNDMMINRDNRNRNGNPQKLKAMVNGTVKPGQQIKMVEMYVRELENYEPRSRL